MEALSVDAVHREVLEATRRMIFNVRAGNADDHGKNHSLRYANATKRWTLSPAYDLSLNFSDGRNYQGLFPSSFGNSLRLSLLAGTAADAGVQVVGPTRKVEQFAQRPADPEIFLEALSRDPALARRLLEDEPLALGRKIDKAVHAFADAGADADAGAGAGADDSRLKMGTIHWGA